MQNNTSHSIDASKSSGSSPPEVAKVTSEFLRDMILKAGIPNQNFDIPTCEDQLSRVESDTEFSREVLLNAVRTVFNLLIIGEDFAGPVAENAGPAEGIVEAASEVPSAAADGEVLS